MPPSLLTLSHLSVARDQQRVLHDVSAQAASHQFVALLGPNGAGKSSLLAAIAGELPLSAGHCLFDSLPLNCTPPHTLARRRALLPQQSMLDFDFTVRDVVKLGALPFPEIPDAELEALCDSVLRLSDAANLAERRYPALSGGEQQRAQIARVLLQACAAAALGPALLLLDEPTANLDPRHQHLMLAGLQELCHSIPLTIIASLHDVNLAMAYTDLAWLLDGGGLLAAGAPAQTLTPKRLTDVFKLPVRNVEGYLLFNLPERTHEAASPPSIG